MRSEPSDSRAMNRFLALPGFVGEVVKEAVLTPEAKPLSSDAATSYSVFPVSPVRVKVTAVPLVGVLWFAAAGQLPPSTR